MTCVITIDGPTASGKGTVAKRVASALGFHYLDSGALYRLTALSSVRAKTDADDATALAHLASRLDIRFVDDTIRLNGQDVTEAIRVEAIGNLASRIATHAPVRTALLQRQQAFNQPPGLVADGRDMGTVVFPQADLKVYLTATVEARAMRRHKQLIDKGISARIDDLSADLAERDARDSGRSVAPLKPATGAYWLDTSNLSIDQAVAQVLAWHAGLSRQL